MACCSTCPCRAEPGLLCLSVVNPRVYGYFAERCRLDESTERNRVLRRSVLDRSRIAFSSADELRKVLAPIAGGAGGGCDCNCGKICVTCNAGYGTMTVKQGTTVLYTGVPVGGCTPGLFGAGTYTVETSVPTSGITTTSATVATGKCDITNITGTPARPPTLGAIADQSYPHAAPGTEDHPTLTITGIAPSPDVPLAGNSSTCSLGVGVLGVGATATDAGGTAVVGVHGVAYTNPAGSAVITFDIPDTPRVFFVHVKVTQNNLSNSACCPNSVIVTFQVTIT